LLFHGVRTSRCHVIRDIPKNRREPRKAICNHAPKISNGHFQVKAPESALPPAAPRDRCTP
jgi:hypothetical protein